MKIKIPAQTSMKITEDAYNRDIKAKSKIGEDNSLSETNNFIAIAAHLNEEKRVYQALSIEHEGNQYLSVLPSPTHLYLSTALEMYQLSEQIKSDKFPKCGKRDKNSNVFLLDFEPGFTHECYTDYLKARITSIIMLISTLENFMNQVVPDNFVYEKSEKGEVKRYNHKEIENSVSFKEKLEKVLPQSINQKKFWSNKIKEFEILNQLYKHRKEFIHLKTKSKEEWRRYSDVFSYMLNFDILESIHTTINIMNLIEEKCVEIE